MDKLLMEKLTGPPAGWMALLMLIHSYTLVHLIELLRFSDCSLETMKKIKNWCKSPLIRHIGRSLLVFQLYYDSWLSPCFGQNPFCSSCGLIVADSMMALVCHEIEDRITNDPADDKCTSLLQNTQPDDGKIIELESVYQDFSGNRGRLRKSILYFIAQSGLVLYYCFELNSLSNKSLGDGKAGDIKNVSMNQFTVAVIIVAIAGDKECGSRFSFKWWRALLCSVHGDGWSDKLCFIVEFVFRFMADFIVNNACRKMILGTAPIMLCVEGHMDFVKDVTAIFFIFQMDDVDDQIKARMEGFTMKYVKEGANGYVDIEMVEDNE